MASSRRIPDPVTPRPAGKVEDPQQTLTKWLRHGPDRLLGPRATPATAYTPRPKATPATDRSNDTHNRVRTDKVDKSGTVTLRVNGHLHHIGIGRTHAGTHVRLLIQNHDITIINAATGEILRELTLDYQPRQPRPRND